MTKEKLTEIRYGLETAYVDERCSSNLAYNLFRIIIKKEKKYS